MLILMNRVMLAKNKETGETCALKIMRNGTGKAYDQIQHMLKVEVSNMKQLEHRNILKVIEYSDKEVILNANKKEVEVSYIAIEFAENGEFFDFIADSERFSEKTARYYFHQLIEALEYIHGLGMAHRDIKPENILLDSDFSIKLGDFGFWTKDDISKTKRGTLGYMAPEVLAGFKYDPKKADLFSAAVILFIMVTQHCPFIRAELNDRYYKRIIRNDIENFWKLHGNTEEFSDSFKDLFIKMTNAVASNRLSINEIKEHEWYNGPLPSDDDIKFEFALRKKSLLSKSETQRTSEKNEENCGNTGENKESTENTSASSNLSDNDQEMEDTVSKLKTPKFMVENGDILVDAIWWFWTSNNYQFEKSAEYFRVTIKLGEDDNETFVQADVWKNSKDSSRNVELIRLHLIYINKTIFNYCIRLRCLIPSTIFKVESVSMWTTDQRLITLIKILLL